MPSGKHFTFEEIKKNLLSFNFKLLEFETTQKPILVECICGKQFYCRYHSIVNKLTKSCGCLQKTKEFLKTKIHDLTGQTFGKWTVIKIDDESIGTSIGIRYICQCSCGTIRKVRSANLVKKITNSCGCAERSRIVDLSGRKVGKLLVLSFSHKDKYDWWKCLCDCGREHLVASNHLITKATKSCGNCSNFRNGRLFSFTQQFLEFQIHRLFPGLHTELNYRIDKYAADIVILAKKIIIEYDTWFWHKDTKDKDQEKIDFLLKNGWKILIIKSNKKLPKDNILKNKINKLLKEKSLIEIITLKDWGKGKSFVEKLKEKI